ncbi:2-oxoacid:acceptor oxidoreductase subunit alpha [Sporomusa acidovorans]|uniref:2-oxoglutarate oxidoreductase subunit KorA n=1 Tax=Sporomusa acidovorans (strain ATCC 49682 / DSM 3132 / Mol) TaxID=1123286 RepID=A0ABZ3J5N6_SPOA4|nr:2-oxoacid:acceptor oxidoreductase subunit alpha [Sporomusa acidovorans]OZC19694.1 2-oxoglutarate oxidoreductase subunit KorA [Sporomusa acidovorans DSM 3132]SDF72221.1 2-oxoglutarate ferredoxin oxidoreductase subunit alpha [Sporomusa acidovorans]
MSKVSLMQGNQAVAEGAIAAGVTFFGGYPITPSTEVAESLAKMLPAVGGKFIQMEDEIAGIGVIIGAALTGKKVMTATSGPGFSLKQELIGYTCIAEIPMVIVNVQRVGPSTGQPTSPAQGDVMQARWGTHGDHPMIALTPGSVPECFDLTIKAYELSEKYRTPVILLLDEVIGHMREKIELPDSYDEIVKPQRKLPKVSPEEYKAYKADDDLVPAMAPFGTGYRWHVTGLVHDEYGFPDGSPAATKQCLDRLHAKINDNLEDIILYETYRMDDAEIAVVAYGGTARTAYDAVDAARVRGIKAGMFRPITLWPFPEKQIKEMAGKVKHILVAEMNCGQYVREVERVVAGKVPVTLHAKYNNEAITPNELLAAIENLK